MSIERRYVWTTDLGAPMEFVTYSDHLAELDRMRKASIALVEDYFDRGEVGQTALIKALEEVQP